MAKMTKAAARRRIAEANRKLSKVYVESMVQGWGKGLEENLRDAMSKCGLAHKKLR